MADPRLRVVAGAATSREKRSRPGGREIGSFRHRVPDGALEALVDGVWHLVCSPCRVLAMTRDDGGRNWGRLVEVRDPDGRLHHMAIPARLIAGRGEPALDILLSCGLQPAPGYDARLNLLRYLALTTGLDGEPLPRALAALRTGWHGDTFVLPGQAIGGDGRVVYQPISAIVAPIRARGTLAEWQATVARPSIGNSRLVLAVSAAFAAPLLGAINYPEGFGVHFRGGSSAGKTTALETGGSVWGGGGLTGYRQSWHATGNGIEAMAEAYCDLLLCLDELGQVRAEDAGRVAYQLSAGSGKQRALADGMAASRREWRLIYLSTGEIGLADKLREARVPQRMMAGQAIRLIDLPADAGAGYGLFEVVPDIPEQPDATARERGRAFADRLVSAAHASYGTAGPAFLEALVADRVSALEQRRREVDALAASLTPSGADGQVQRAARHFALIGAAGELAANLGIVPWPTGEAAKAAMRCFHDWLRTRGTIGAAEIMDVVAHLRAVIERDGASRFQREGSLDAVRDRLGFVRDSHGDTVYLILPEAWKALMAGRDPGRAARDLLGLGILEPGEGGRTARNERLPGSSRTQRVYAVRHSALFRDAPDREDANDV